MPPKNTLRILFASRVGKRSCVNRRGSGFRRVLRCPTYGQRLCRTNDKTCLVSTSYELLPSRPVVVSQVKAGLLNPTYMLN